MLNLNVIETKKMTDAQGTALMLLCLVSSVGEGVSIAEIARFTSVQSHKSFSKYRAENLMKNLVEINAVIAFTETTPGGRIYRKYVSTAHTFTALMLYVEKLPKLIRPRATELLKPILDAAIAVRKEAVRQRGEVL